MIEETERLRVRKERILNKLPYEDIKEKLLESYNTKSRINRVLNDQLNKLNSMGLNKKSGFNMPITTSNVNRKKLDQSKSFMNDPGKKVIHNRKLINANFKEVKKLLTKNVDIDIKERIFKKGHQAFQSFAK